MKTSPFIFFPGALLALSLQSCTQRSAYPNIIYVMTDDQGYGDLACNGNPAVLTPNIDQFASEALRLTNYHTGTTSTPTRGGLLTGRNSLRNCTWHTIGGCSILHPREKTIGEYFQEAGYATGLFGKWHLGDNNSYAPEKRGFDEAVCLRGGGVGQTPGYWGNDYFDDVYYHNGEPVRHEGYCTDIFFDEAISFISRHKHEPFFCYLSTNAPHSPYNVPEKYYDLYKDNDQLLESQKRFYGMITNIDANFGRLEKFLADNDLTENTILIFTTDNGSSDKRHFYTAGMRGHKGSQYEGGHRVPFFMRWPAGGFSEGKVYSGLSAHVDVLPTLLSFAGIEAEFPHPLDGIDLKPYILSGKEADRMLVTDVQRIQWPDKGRKSCVMKSDWRLIDGKELYNVTEDPGQRKDVSEAHPELVAEMQDFYNGWWEDAEKDFEYSSIDIVPDAKNYICAHDLHSDQAPAWSQKKVRAGELSPASGYYCLDILEEGDYLFELRRWPEETGWSLSSSTHDGYEATVSRDPVEDGVSLKFRSGFVEAEGWKQESPADNDAESVDVTVHLKAGRIELKTVLVLEDGRESGAWYTVITKVK